MISTTAAFPFGHAWPPRFLECLSPSINYTFIPTWLDDPTLVDSSYKYYFLEDSQEVKSMLVFASTTEQTLFLHPYTRKPNLSKEQWQAVSAPLATF
jgi:hypothetical protein